jgi:hypothetical protein
VLAPARADAMYLEIRVGRRAELDGRHSLEPPRFGGAARDKGGLLETRRVVTAKGTHAPPQLFPCGSHHATRRGCDVPLGVVREAQPGCARNYCEQDDEQEEEPTPHVRAFRTPNDIEFSGERKRVRCKDEVDSSFMT